MPHFSPPAGFRSPDMSGPLNVPARLKACPLAAETRGMFFLDALAAMKNAGGDISGFPRFQSFRMYPQRSFLEIAPVAAAAAFPDLPPKEGLRRLGQRAYPTFGESIAGRVMFGVLGHDLAAVLRLVPRGYAAVVSHASAELIDEAPRAITVRLNNVHTFLDCYQVGVFEGAIVACREVGEVFARFDSQTTGDFHIMW